MILSGKGNGPMKIVVDSSAWIEFFLGTPAAKPVRDLLRNAGNVIVPTVVVLEVVKWVRRHHGEAEAARRAVVMKQGVVADLTVELAMKAVEVGFAHKLATADSIVYATALENKATVWTFDADFEGLAGGRCLAKGAGG